MTFNDAMHDFQKIEYELRELFGAATQSMIKDTLDNFCNCTHSKTKDSVMTIKHQSLINKILDPIGNEICRSILYMLIDKPHTSYEIIENLGIPSTTGYRKIEQLIDAGLLIETGQKNSDYGRPANYLVTLYRGFSMQVVQNKVILNLIVSKEIMHQSSIICIICNLRCK